jgi:hypothetical protein
MSAQPSVRLYSLIHLGVMQSSCNWVGQIATSLGSVGAVGTTPLPLVSCMHAGAPRTPVPDERWNNVYQLIKTAAAERQVDEDALRVVDDDEVAVLVKKKLTAKSILSLTTYNELVAAGVSEGTAKVLKMLFPDTIKGELVCRM